jgi:hypothetical protein
MTIDQGVASRIHDRSLAWRVGAASTAAIGIVLIAWALSLDFAKASNGAFFGDAATYYELGHSLADDLDFEYQKQDLERVWHEYGGGPEGLFLKRHDGKLFFAKSYIYPLFAAPFVRLFGTNGFLVLHALLMTGCFLCAYAFLAARSHPLGALIFAFAFLFVSVTPVYMVQLGPDFFNFALILFAYFFWCYKEVDGPVDEADLRSWRTQWLLSQRSDMIAAALIGIATFSKPTHILLIGPLLASAVLRSQWLRTLKIGVVFVLVTAGLFGVNIAATGEWNYQGGERKTFYSAEGKGFPFQSEGKTFDSVGISRVGGGQVEAMFTRDALVHVFPRNLAYFFIGRSNGFAIYFFPGMLAILLFLAATRDRAMWQWLTLAGGLGSAVFLLLYMPYTWSGGGGPVGNRYFLGTYAVFLFLLPPLQTAVGGLLAMAISSLFVAPILSNPFWATTHPQDHSKTGLFKLLPIELTMVNDLPVNVAPTRTRVPLGGTPTMFGYFIDDNVYGLEGDRFWVRGESSADILLRARLGIEIIDGTTPPPPPRSLKIESLEVQLETGPKPNRVSVSNGYESHVEDMPAGSQRSFTMQMPDGVPYRPDNANPTNYVYRLTITNSSGFVPMFENGANDSRFLGVMVKLVPHYEGQQ